MPKIIKNMPFEEYLAVDALSSTGLKIFMSKTPAHYKAYVEKGITRTPAMRLGSIVHGDVLEGVANYVSLPYSKHNMATSPGKAAFYQELRDKQILPDEIISEIEALPKKSHIEYLEKNYNIEIISDADGEMISGFKKNIMANPNLKDKFSNGEAEVSVFWMDEETGVECKARFDWLTYFMAKAGISIPIIFDLKTCGDASEYGFGKQIEKFGYDISAAFYKMGYSAAFDDGSARFVFVAAEKETHFINLWEMKSEHTAYVSRIIRAGLYRFAECNKLNEWPGYDKKIKYINMSNWYEQKITENNGEIKR